MLFLFFFFLISGFCSLLYELVWMRLSMAAFGVTTALTSIVLSVFMAGMGLGSWGSGRIIEHCQRRYRSRMPLPPLLVYALLELSIGTSALLVPMELRWGRILTERLALASSFSFYVASGLCVALALLPWCAAMGATIPVGMLALAGASSERSQSQRYFSYLYMANVTGALAGTVVPLFLIEMFGFHGTLRVGAALNAGLALSASVLAWWWRGVAPVTAWEDEAEASSASGKTSGSSHLLLLLFLTGLTSMGAELVWIRQYTFYVGTVVYAFAAILGFYLWATSMGAMVYRRRNPATVRPWVWGLLGLAALCPLVTANPEVQMAPLLRLSMGIVPFSGLLGFLTPMLVDRWSGGDAHRVGTAYAVNILGCIAGPLLSGFVLLPLLDERHVLFLLALPWFWIEAAQRWARPPAERAGGPNPPVWSYALLLAGAVVLVTSRGYEERFPQGRVLRDNTATVVAAQSGGHKRLLVNGVGITSLTPITKMMAHLPLAFLERPPQNALVICFGMGTTFRSLLSWGISATAVELVPSVPRLFGYFHEDGPALLLSPKARVVIDDGRRYLERTTEQYDVVTIDPPPPVWAAGSSLLYTKEFYATLRERLRPGGILQQWLPEYGDDAVAAAVARSLKESFPYVRAFSSVEGWGTHFLASDQPLTDRTAEGLAARVPPQAMHDLLEWGPFATGTEQFGAVLVKEIPLAAMIERAPETPALQDDLPVNEYFLMRRSGWLVRGTRGHPELSAAGARGRR